MRRPPRHCPHDCPCGAPRHRSQSQRQPTRPICEVEEREEFTRRIEDAREADFRLANRCTGRFPSSLQHFKFSRIYPRRSSPVSLDVLRGSEPHVSQSHHNRVLTCGHNAFSSTDAQRRIWEVHPRALSVPSVPKIGHVSVNGTTCTAASGTALRNLSSVEPRTSSSHRVRADCPKMTWVTPSR